MKIRTFLSIVLLSAGLILFSNEAYTQTDPSTFEIPVFTYGDPIEEKMQKAAEEADLDIYRLRDKQRILNFKNGGAIVLYSAMELKSKGKNIDPLNYPEDTPKGYKEPVYDLTAEGKLVQYYEPVSNGKTK